MCTSKNLRANSLPNLCEITKPLWNLIMEQWTGYKLISDTGQSIANFLLEKSKGYVADDQITVKLLVFIEIILYCYWTIYDLSTTAKNVSTLILAFISIVNPPFQNIVNTPYQNIVNPPYQNIVNPP